MMAIVLGLMVVFIFIQILNLTISVRAKFDTPLLKKTDDELPEITILVAARNEEQNIAKCLKKLVEQNYPTNKLNILIGNDQSTDDTSNIVEEFAEKYSFIKQIHITEQLGKARGKANVLAQLAHHAKGTYFLITDADIQVGPNWARTLVDFFEPNIGIVSGTTIVKGKGYLSNMQHIDWLYFMGLLLSFSRIKIYSTAVGNNMAISREAYFSTGGYENFKFSVTEDYKLFEQVRLKGYQTINMINPEAINISEPAQSLNILMNQRKRWLTGGKELPFYWWIIFAIYGSFWIAFIACIFLNPTLAFILLAAKFLLQSITIYWLQNLLQIPTELPQLFWYEVYTLGLTLLTSFYFIWPTKLNWKNRYY